MSVEVTKIELLLAHYLWMLKDLGEARDLVRAWGLVVKDELSVVEEAREGLARLVGEGTEVI